MEKNCKLCIFCSLSTWSRKLGIKTLTLLTTIDCLETIRRLNIMAVPGTFLSFQKKNLRTKFEKRLLVSKSFSFSICSSCACVCGVPPPQTLFETAAHPVLFAATATQWGHSDFLTRGHALWEVFLSAVMPAFLEGLASCSGCCRGDGWWGQHTHLKSPKSFLALRAHH